MDMMTIWKTVIKSKLDNCSQLWSPSDQSLIQKLDSSVSSLEKMERSPEQDSIPDSKLIYTTLSSGLSGTFGNAEKLYM